MTKTKLLLAGLGAALLFSTAALAGPFKGAVHGTVTLTKRDGSTTQLSLDRGRITSTSPLTIQRKGGQPLSFSTTDKTVVRGTLAVGNPAFVVSQAGAAVLVRTKGAADSDVKGPGLYRGSVHAALALVLRDGSAQTVNFDRGRITAIDGSSVTVKQGAKTLTFSTDGSTVVREKGESVGLDELAVGERAMFFSDGAGHLSLVRCIKKA